MDYGIYTFLCRFQGEAQLPPFKGSTFRGVFGHALRRVVCPLRQKVCGACILRETCLYYGVFENSRRDAVHPFVMAPPLEERLDFGPGETFQCTLVLFGEATRALPYFVYTFDRMGEIGIGAAINGQKGHFLLEEVRAGGDLLYAKSAHAPFLLPGATSLTIEDGGGEARRLRVLLKTPLRVKHDNLLTHVLPFHILVRACLRRISSLFNAYGGGEPNLDYPGLDRAARGVETVHSSLRWFMWERYSNRQRKRMPVGGLVGDITYEGNLNAFLPLLHAAEKVHIGKQTTFGLGKIQTEVLA